MFKSHFIRQITQSGVIAILRAPDSSGLLDAAEALVDGGIRALEFTLNTPNAMQLISEARKILAPEVLIGAGTVLTRDAAEEAIRAGAQFIITPGLQRGVIFSAHGARVPAIPGALTPTEVLIALRWGADLIKIFPASAHGPDYLRALSGPYPSLRMVPAGGVSAENASEYIRAGAAAVAAGGKLVDLAAVRRKDFETLKIEARKILQAVADGRKSKHPMGAMQ